MKVFALFFEFVCLFTCEYLYILSLQGNGINMKGNIKTSLLPPFRHTTRWALPSPLQILLRFRCVKHVLSEMLSAQPRTFHSPSVEPVPAQSQSVGCVPGGVQVNTCVGTGISPPMCRPGARCSSAQICKCFY